MQTCRTCKFAAIRQQQCRAGPPTCAPVPSSRGPMMFGGFPGLPPDGEGCGAHAVADAAELERREREHPVTEIEIPDDSRTAKAVRDALEQFPDAEDTEVLGKVMVAVQGKENPAVALKLIREGRRPRLVT